MAIKIVATRGDRFLADLTVEQLPALLSDPQAMVWVDLAGAADEVAWRVLREVFRFHPLAIEDCFESREHPKVQAYDGYLYQITHGLAPTSTPEKPEIVELDAFLGKQFLLTYHEAPSRSIAAVTELVAQNAETLRRGPALVLHAILERQVDNIEPVLDVMEERLVGLEERVLGRPSDKDLMALLAIRRSALHLRRWMVKQREVVLRLSRNEFALVAAQDALLFRDVYDHLVRFTDLLETQIDLTSSIQTGYLSAANNRLNETMKFLTLFTALLMPLTLLTGIYGMNFEHMPELKSPWGYPAVLLVMLATAGAVLWFFRRKGWLGREVRAPRLPRQRGGGEASRARQADKP